MPCTHCLYLRIFTQHAFSLLSWIMKIFPSEAEAATSTCFCLFHCKFVIWIKCLMLQKYKPSRKYQNKSVIRGLCLNDVHIKQASGCNWTGAVHIVKLLRSFNFPFEAPQNCFHPSLINLFPPAFFPLLQSKSQQPLNTRRKSFTLTSLAAN